MVTANVQRLTVSWPDARVCFYRGEVVLPGPVSRIEAKTLMYSSCAWVRGGVLVAASVQRLAITPLNHKQWVCPPRSHANKSPPRPAVANLLMAVTKNCAMANTPRLQVETHQDVLETSASRPAGTSLLKLLRMALPQTKPSRCAGTVGTRHSHTHPRLGTNTNSSGPWLTSCPVRSPTYISCRAAFVVLHHPQCMGSKVVRGRVPGVAPLRPKAALLVDRWLGGRVANCSPNFLKRENVKT